LRPQGLAASTELAVACHPPCNTGSVKADEGTTGAGGGPAAVVLAVPEETLDELLEAGLVKTIPTIRGPVMEAVATIGANSAVLVTLLQAPETVRAFAAWLVAWVRRREDTVTINARRGSRRVELRVDGDVPMDVVADFLSAAFRYSSGETSQK